MTNLQKRSMKEGVLLGVAAGLLFAVMEVFASAMMGNPPFQPVRMFASIVLGKVAMGQAGLGIVFLAGGLVHVTLSAAFGFVYGAVNGWFERSTKTGLGAQLAMGLGFGVAIWFVNFQLVAPLAYPWFLNAPQALQAVMHAMFFGVPLALMYRSAERRAPAAPFRTSHA